MAATRSARPARTATPRTATAPHAGVAGQRAGALRAAASVASAQPASHGSRQGRAPHPSDLAPVTPAAAAGPRGPGATEALRGQAAAELLARADAELLAAQLASDPAERFTHAHMGALRVAGAVLAVLGSRPPRGRTRSAWDRLSADAHDFAPWASFFASGAHLRSAVDAGRFDAVDESVAARWVAASEDFRDEVGRWVDDETTPVAHGMTPVDTPVSA